MRHVNKVFLLGSVGKIGKKALTGKPPHLAVTLLSLVTSVQWTQENGAHYYEVKEQHDCELTGKLAAVALKLLKKGSNVHIQGHLRTRRVFDNNDVEYVAVVVVADDFRRLTMTTEN